MIEFSIITPCGYRDHKRILGLEESLNHQTYKNFEWIVSSSSSNFGLPQEDFPKYVLCPTKNNVGNATNYALKVANGKYILFVDADDYLKPNALQTVYNLIQKYPNSSNIFNLRQYITYEPQSSFTKRNQTLKDQEINLPQWGDNKHDPIKLSNVRIDNGKKKYQHLNTRLLSEGKIIPRKMIIQNHLKLANTDLGASRPFMAQLLSMAHAVISTKDYLYIMVRHNDPINDPSLYEIKNNTMWAHYIQIDYDTLSQLRGYQAKKVSPSIKAFAQYTLNQINTYFYKIAITDDVAIYKNRIQTFDQLRTYFTMLKSIKGLKYNKTIVNDVISGNYTKALKRMREQYNLRMLHKLALNHGKELPKVLYFKYYLKQPIKKHTILFESFLGRNYSDNPKYIYKYLQKHYMTKFHFVWIADAKHLQQIKSDLHGYPNTEVIKRFGFKYMKYLATSKYFVFNMRQPKWFIKRQGMHFLETWHGTPLKRLVFDLKDVTAATKLYKETFYHQSRQWDNLIAPNAFSANIFSHAFMYPKNKMILTSYPRNTPLAENKSRQQEIANQVKHELHIPEDKKVILYAPTWRDNHYFAPGQYEFKLHLNLKLLKHELGNKYVVLLRTHYFIANQIDTSQYGNFVRNVSDYDDITKLYLASDILITDYSSVFFDYAQLDRPILYYVYDYDSYAKVLHGFYLSMQENLPGPLLKTSSQVVDAIKNIKAIKDKYSERYYRFNKKFNNWKSTKSSAKVVSKFFHLK